MPPLAIGAVPEVAIWVVALAAVLILAAAYVFFRIIEGVLKHLPLVGGFVAHTISNHLEGAIKGVISWADGASRAVAHWLWAHTVAEWVVGDKTVAAIGNAKVAAIHGQLGAALASNEATIAQAMAVERAAHAEAAAKAAAVQLSEIVHRELALDINAIRAHLPANTVLAIESTIARAEHLYNLAERDLATATARLQAQINAVATATGAGGAAGLAALEQQLAAAVATAQAAAAAAQATAQQIAHLLASLPATGSTVALDAGAADVVNPSLDALLPALGTIVGSLPATVVAGLHMPTLTGAGDITGVVSALGLLAPAIAATATEVAECAVPMCRNLGGLSNLLQSLGTDIFLAALLAFLVEAARSPSGAARTIDQVVAPLVGDISAGVRDLVGV